jgi:hypothetical protein
MYERGFEIHQSYLKTKPSREIQYTIDSLITNLPPSLQTVIVNSNFSEALYGNQVITLFLLKKFKNTREHLLKKVKAGFTKKYSIKLKSGVQRQF